MFKHFGLNVRDLFEEHVLPVVHSQYPGQFVLIKLKQIKWKRSSNLPYEGGGGGGGGSLYSQGYTVYISYILLLINICII